MVEWLQSLQLDSPRVGRTWDEVVTVKLTWVTGVGKPLPPFCLLPPSPLFYLLAFFPIPLFVFGSNFSAFSSSLPTFASMAFAERFEQEIKNGNQERKLNGAVCRVGMAGCVGNFFVQGQGCSKVSSEKLYNIKISNKKNKLKVTKFKKLLLFFFSK